MATHSSPALLQATIEVKGPGLAADVCGSLLALVGADVRRTSPGPAGETPPAVLEVLRRHMTLSPSRRRGGPGPAVSVDALVRAGRPGPTRDRPRGIGGTPAPAVTTITPFGSLGPRSDWRATDLTTFFESGLARVLVGPVEDPVAEPPVRAFGQQSAYIAGATAACATALALLGRRRTGRSAAVDVSAQEALAFVASRDLARPAFGTSSRSRRRVGDGNGATVCILPARDGFVVISPREEHQWRAWLGVMGGPAWAGDPRFARHADRAKNWDALYPLLCDWSRNHGRREIADAAQAAHVPAFPLLSPASLLDEPQLNHRRFALGVGLDGLGRRLVAGSPFHVVFDQHGTPRAGSRPGAAFPLGQAAPAFGPSVLPLAGIRVLDFSWVIAGPTCTRFLAAMGAEVIKVESPDRLDPGRASELHAVLGQGKRSVLLDLKTADGLEAARALVATVDVVVENFAPGVMDRLGLGYETLRGIRPGLVMLSASGLGQEGPGAHQVAYGTALQCYTGFATLNGSPGSPPRVGMAWLDPLCGLLMATGIAAALDHRERTGEGVRLDFSMLEGLLWTMTEALLAGQGSAAPAAFGNRSRIYAPHGAVPCAGDDRWVAVAVTTAAEWRALCDLVPGLAGLERLSLSERRRREPEIVALLARWSAQKDADEAANALQAAGIPAGVARDFAELYQDPHLAARGFYGSTEAPDGRPVRLPALPWRWDVTIAGGRAPLPGKDNDWVLASAAGRPGETAAAPRPQ